MTQPKIDDGGILTASKSLNGYLSGEFNFGRVYIPNGFNQATFDLITKVTKTAQKSTTKWWRAN